jgi:CxxC motif-containing protein
MKFILALFLLLTFMPVHAAIERHLLFEVRQLTLSEITQSADRIFSGKCTKREDIEYDSIAKLPVVQYTFKINEKIKGIDGNKEISFKVWEGLDKQNGYQVGAEYVIALYPTSERGLTSSVGIQQGKFDIEKIGSKKVINKRVKIAKLSKDIKSRRIKKGRPKHYRQTS